MSLDADAVNVVVKAMALTDVWNGSEHDFNSDFATVSLMELEELAAAVEPFRHTLLNPAHVRSDCEHCAEAEVARS